MEKKTKLSENPKLAKIIYSIVIAVLCITAIVIGIVAANTRDNTTLPDTPPSSSGQDSTDTPDNKTEETPKEDTPTPEKKPLTFISPVSGSVVTEHSMTVPVFSPTLEEWRIHTGIDISTEDSAAVFAAADGVVSEISTHPRFGYTVKINHEGGVTTIYSNLSSLEDIAVKVGDTVKCGDKIANVGDSAVFELAEEPHLHFEVLKNGVQTDPLEVISEESKRASLGIEANS